MQGPWPHGISMFRSRCLVQALTCTLLISLVAPLAALAETPLAARLPTPSLTQPSSGEIRSVAILLSGDEGWTPELQAFAQRIATLDALVIGIDLRASIRADADIACADLAAALVEAARDAEARSEVDGYIQPILIGWGSGSGLAYAAMLQAGPDTFKGVFGFGFCSELILAKPLCRRGGLKASRDAGDVEELQPVSKVPSPWTLFDGIAPSCRSVRAFAEGIDGATVVARSGADWFESFSDAYLPIAGDDFSFRPPAEAAEGLGDLPLVEIRRPAAAPSRTLVIFLSGDGGWAELDQQVSDRLAAHGLPVVGVSSLRYFWGEKDPEQIARDVGRIARYYAQRWGTPRFILAGYSFGADVAPFAATRLRQDTGFAGVALLAPGPTAAFVFHISGWLGQNQGTAETEPETEKLTGVPVACIYGSEEEDSLCPRLGAPNVTATRIAGDHHFDGNYDAVAAAVLALATRIGDK